MTNAGQKTTVVHMWLHDGQSRDVLDFDIGQSVAAVALNVDLQ